MKKKIYAVRRGKKPGIYEVWAETQQQVMGFSGAQYRGFTYMTEKENEDETVEMSRAYAMKQARNYLEGVLDGSEKAGKLPEEEADYHEIEKAVLKKESEAGFYEDVLAPAGLVSDAYGNSPWVAALIKAVSTPGFLTKISMSPYSCTSLYTAVFCLIFVEDKILGAYEKKLEELPVFEKIKDIWHESEDYIQLKKRFEEYGMEASDLLEIFNRARLKEKQTWESYSLLSVKPKSQIAMKQFIRQGHHTVMGLYKELVGNPVYRTELLEISGTFQNPDLEKEIQVKEAKRPMQDIVLQTSAVSMELTEKVIGQNDVIDKLEKAYFHTELTVNAGAKKRGPRSAYLFAGPPGVGKTYIAEIMANTLDIPYKRFDMSGYSRTDTVTELMGSSTLYKDSKPGVLTNFVHENPRCVLLFDEVEKACREVVLLFLQILDEGKCFDRHYDKDISFRDAIVILTTNAGKQLYQDAGNENLTLLPDNVIIDALKKDLDPGTQVPFFPPEIISRMASHTIIMFNHLRADAILKIIRADLEKQLKIFSQNYGYDIEGEKDKIAATALYSMGGSLDARNATVLAGKLLDRGLYEFLTLTEEKVGLDRRSSIRKIVWEHDFSGTADEIQQFYSGEKNCVIAIFGQAEKMQIERLEENNVQIKMTADPEEFTKILNLDPVILTAVDYEYGLKEKESNLSIADITTEGSRVFSHLKEEYGDVPVYILYGDNGYSYSKREKQALLSRGAQGFINRENIQTEILKAYIDICCRQTVETLSLRHQRLTYDLRNELDEKQKSGKIVICNFKLESAVEAEDQDLMMSADLRPDIHWDDIYVSDTVKKELNYFIDFLKNPTEYLQKGARRPKGILMTGYPGTGKTSLAKVIATESGVSFLEIGADTLMSQGAREVRRIFRTARKYAPAVLFIDEIDAVGMDRGQTTGNTALDALLVEMDGIKKIDDKPVFVMAATNLGSRIDGALQRRFDITCEIELPDAKGRKWMLERLIRKNNHAFHVSDEEIDSIVLRSERNSFADIEKIVEAALREAIRSGRPVDDTLLDEAFENFKYGEAREGRPLGAMRHVAYHEAGHALIQLFYHKIPDYMSVVARGKFGGYVLEGAAYGWTKGEILENICGILGGRAAEIVCGYGLTYGASSDLEKATALAAKMVCEFGMYEEEIGLAVISKAELACNEKAKNLINQILSEQLQEAIRIIREKKDALERLVNAVMKSEKKYLTKKQIEAAYSGTGIH